MTVFKPRPAAPRQGLKTARYLMTAKSRSNEIAHRGHSARCFPVTETGAAGDGAANETAAFQAAVDKISSRGGGSVYVPPGRYRVGSIELKSGVELYLEAGATLAGSTDKKDYSEPAILWAQGARDIALTGRGCIEGAGSAFPKGKMIKPHVAEPSFRPHNIHFQDCKRVQVLGIHLLKSSSWMQRYFRCNDVQVRGIRVFNFDNHNADGIDFVSCRNVTMSDSVIYSDDDAFCLKTVTDDPCENIVVSNCVFGSHCNAIKFGTESYGDFRNVSISNCVVAPPPCDTVWYGCAEGHGGIDLASVDGATLENVSISNISIRKTLCPIFIRLGARCRPYQNGKTKAPGKLRNVSIDNVVAMEAGRFGCEITGLRDCRVQDITLSNISMGFAGGEPGAPGQTNGAPVPEYPDKYPNPGMHGPLPSYGFFFRHVDGLSLRNIALTCDRPGGRPALLADDVAALDISGFRATAPASGQPVMRLERVRGARINGCMPMQGTKQFLAAGAECQDLIGEYENDRPKTNSSGS